MKMRSRHDRARRGNATLEFVLAWSLLWGLFGGTYQFGQAMYAYNILKTAVADAAALGAQLDYDVSDPDAFDTALKNVVVYGDLNTGTRVRLRGITAANVAINANLVNDMPTKVEVSIQNFAVNTIFNTFTFSNKPRSVFTYMGHVTCSRC